MSIVMLTTVHPRYDTRICFKQARYLADIYGDKFQLVVADGLGDENDGSLVLVDLGVLSGSRAVRVIKGWVSAVRFLLKTKPTIVHFHDPELLPIVVVCRLFGFKTIYDVHDDLSGSILHKHWIPDFLKRPLATSFRGFEAVATRFCNHIVTATPEIAKYFPTAKTTTVHNYPSITELQAKDTVPFQARPPQFFYVGGISAVRAFREPIHALADINRDVADSEVRECVTMSICGSFRPPSLMEEAKRTPGWEHVRFNGWCNREKISQEMERSICGVVLFYDAPNNRSSQPNKMFEYMAGGLPVIASDFPLWRAIIEGNNCGIVVDPNSKDEVTRAMRKLITDRDQAEAMGKNGRRAVEDKFNWEVESKKLKRIYDNLDGYGVQ